MPWQENKFINNQKTSVTYRKLQNSGKEIMEDFSVDETDLHQDSIDVRDRNSIFKIDNIASAITITNSKIAIIKNSSFIDLIAWEGGAILVSGESKQVNMQIDNNLFNSIAAVSS